MSEKNRITWNSVVLTNSVVSRLCKCYLIGEWGDHGAWEPERFLYICDLKEDKQWETY